MYFSHLFPFPNSKEIVSSRLTRTDALVNSESETAHKQYLHRFNPDKVVKGKCLQLIHLLAKVKTAFSMESH